MTKGLPRGFEWSRVVLCCLDRLVLIELEFSRFLWNDLGWSWVVFRYYVLHMFQYFFLTVWVFRQVKTLHSLFYFCIILEHLRYCVFISKFQKLYFQRISILGEHNWYIEDTTGFKKSSSKNIGMTPPGFWTREGLPSQSLKSIEVTKNIRRKISAQRFPCFISRSKKKVKMFYIFYFFAI